MKYEDILIGGGEVYVEGLGKVRAIAQGKLREFLGNMIREVVELDDNIIHQGDSMLDDLYLSHTINYLREIDNLVYAECIIHCGLKEINDPQSLFWADKMKVEYGNDVLCRTIESRLKSIKAMKFEDYRAQNLHKEICQFLKLLYEDYSNMYKIKDE